MTSTSSGLLYVSNFLSATHNRSYCEDLTARLEAHGWEITRTSSQANRALRLLDMVRTVWTRRRTYRIAAVDLFSGAAFLWAEAACFELSRLNKPFLITLHGGNLPEFAMRWPRRVRRLLASATIVSAPSRFMQQRMQAHCHDIVVIRNGLDVHAHPFRQRTQPAPRLVWVRAFHTMYNPLLAIEVLARLRVARPDATLTMIGPDKGDGSLAAVQRRLQVLGLEQAVRIVGGVPKPEVATHLAEADVFVNTTNVDNTPLSVLEAMASGLCIVSTEVGGIPFLVRDDHDALLVPPRDEAAMAAAVERILVEPGLAARLSAAARASAIECDWAPVVETWERTLSQLQDNAA